MKWDVRAGADIIVQYPSDFQLNPKIMMQIYSLHETLGKVGTATLNSEIGNFFSYYAGSELAKYLILVLPPDDDSVMYEDALIGLAPEYVRLQTKEEEIEKISLLYDRLYACPIYGLTQKLALILHNALDNKILSRLRDEIAFPQSEVEVWIRESFPDLLIDVPNSIEYLVQTGFIKIASVKGLASDLLFHVGDILALRQPPIEYFENLEKNQIPVARINLFRAETRNFFLKYAPTEEDTYQFLDRVILHPVAYQLYEHIRKGLFTRAELEQIVKDLKINEWEKIVQNLVECHAITAIIDKNSEIEYFGIKTDFYLDKIYPSYNIETIKKHYQTQHLHPKILLKALDLMRETYIAQSNKSKTKSNKVKVKTTKQKIKQKAK